MGVINLNGRQIAFSDEKNLLEVIRKAGIELPTFCYHSELSVYGGCRMCVVEVEDMGMVASCCTPPQDGMVVRTHTNKLRKVRRMALELLLANHDRECTTCAKSRQCRLQDLAHRLGVDEVRFGHRDRRLPIDNSSPSIVRDPNKCILCGDCVRMCEEVQGIGVLGFANRGSDVVVTPAFNKKMSEVECVSCGQCVAVCPTGALTVKSQIEQAYAALADEEKTVIAQIAPAVRVSIGEAFGLSPGENVLGKLVSALKQLEVDKVFDTSTTADLTVIEETEELVARLEKGTRLPLLTSCCPAWVKFAEQYYPELLDNLSTCRSPQQMFGSLIKRFYARKMGIDPEKLYVISIMPCTAKKFEAARPELADFYGPDVDLVLTTQEVVAMIREMGLDFASLEVEAMDGPLAFATGAGIIFGSTGGVSEAVLRYAAERLTDGTDQRVDFTEVRGQDGIRLVTADLGEQKLRLGVAHGLANARKLIEEVLNGEVQLDLIEVMACPGGCVGGGGQPQAHSPQVKASRAKGLYEAEKMTQLRKSQQNPVLTNLYETWLEHPGSPRAHAALHTTYHSRRRMQAADLALESGKKLDVEVCLGTCCYKAGSYDVLKEISRQLEQENLVDAVNLKGTFCFERCGGGPTVRVGSLIQGEMTPEKVPQIMKRIKHLVYSPAQAVGASEALPDARESGK